MRSKNTSTKLILHILSELGKPMLGAIMLIGIICTFPIWIMLSVVVDALED
jgi:hypothetical protein